jgi:hypothetical protein
MTLEEILSAAVDRNLTFADIEALLAICPEPPRLALDRLATELAIRFVSRQVDIAPADSLANVMFGYAAKHDVLGDTLHGVFLAFDAGEFIPDGQPPSLDPVAVYTRPQLAKILTGVLQSNISLQADRER